MLLVLDKDSCLYIFDSVDAAESDLEAIDIENDEYQFCDDSGRSYTGELVPCSPGFRIVQRGLPNPHLPLSFIERAKHFWPQATPFKSFDDARTYFSRVQT
jgi:hypothetical protein